MAWRLWKLLSGAYYGRKWENGRGLLTISNVQDIPEELESLNVDRLLSGYQLLGIDGHEMLRVLKERRVGIPVARVRASTRPVIMGEAERPGVDKIALKAYSKGNILTVTQGLLS